MPIGALMKRRTFLAAPAAAGLMQAASAALRVSAIGDGIPYSPSEFAQRVAALTAASEAEPDDYSRGGVVALLEKRMAAILGKEAAIWMPTGTLANHLALRALAGSRRRVFVQAESHIYNDSGDCAQTLSGLTLIPLAPGRATFTVEDLDRAWAAGQSGRVAVPVGAIQVETPVRRRSGERFDSSALEAVVAWGRERGAGLHLDGARLFVESAYSERPVKEYAALFDTVYISLYKCFNSGIGAMLAGPQALVADMHHTRRMFGGGLQQVWPHALLPLDHLQTFEAEMRQARKISEQVITALSSDANFLVERVPNGTNVFRLKAASVNAPVFQMRLEEAGVAARTPQQDWFLLQVNPTWARVPAAELVRRLRQALG